MNICPVCGTPNDPHAVHCISCGAQLENPLPKIEKYDLQKVLGSGGFGITYLATDLNTGRKGVLKEFFPSGSMRKRDGSVELPQGYNLDEVLQEARVLARFKHESINMCYTAERLNGTAYLFLEFIEGKDLTSVYHSGILTPGLVKSILIDLLHALDYVHSQGFLHLDLKPENILLSEGRPVLIDFGSAVLHGSQSSRIVTHGYSAPEQYSKGLTLGSHTDFYALGGVVFYLLTGRVPPSALVRMSGEDQDSEELVRQLSQDTPEELKQVVRRCMALAIPQRPSAASDLLQVFGVQSKLQTAPKPSSENQSKESQHFHLGVQAEEARDFKEAARRFETAARQGHLEAAYRLGQLHHHGLGVNQDFYEGFHWSSTAASGGHAAAQAHMGWLCFYGCGTFRSIKQAVAWFGKAADQGHPEGLCWLGKLHLMGRGVPLDEDQGFKFIKQAALKEHPEAEFQMGMAYLNGVSVNRHPSRAMYWFERAADHGHLAALYQLGRLYRTGEAGVTDLIRSREFFLKAFVSGFLEAEKEL